MNVVFWYSIILIQIIFDYWRNFISIESKLKIITMTIREKNIAQPLKYHSVRLVRNRKDKKRHSLCDCFIISWQQQQQQQQLKRNRIGFVFILNGIEAKTKIGNGKRSERAQESQKLIADNDEKAFLRTLCSLTFCHRDDLRLRIWISTSEIPKSRRRHSIYSSISLSDTKFSLYRTSFYPNNIATIVICALSSVLNSQFYIMY